ncbi:MAG: pyridoxamine 5'-phosphate oxidase family protein [Bacteroidales bacterium]|nr:pyridoxamine 5'-phosphate oxidase family protein [Bacteroidales bacterium]
MMLLSCRETSGPVPFQEVERYFFRNDAAIPEDARIDSQEAFDRLFAPAAVMGRGGTPTPVDFSRETVIAVVCPVTDRATELRPESLVREGGELVFTCTETVGEPQGWSMQPVLLVKVNRSFDTGKVRVVKQTVLASLQAVRDFLHKVGYYFLATADGDQPQVRPFGTAEIIDGRLCIQTGHVKNVAHQIAANPKVALCAYDGEKWLRLTATLVEDSRVETKKAMLDANPSLRSMYDEHDGNTAVYCLTEAKGSISSFTAPPVEIRF